VVPSGQTSKISNPYAAIRGPQHSRNVVGIGQALLGGNGDHGLGTKAVEAIGRGHPDIALTILEEGRYVGPGETIRGCKHTPPARVDENEACLNHDPQTAIAVPVQSVRDRAIGQRIRFRLLADERLDSCAH
jgi:hypothetical protein